MPSVSAKGSISALILASASTASPLLLVAGLCHIRIKTLTGMPSDDHAPVAIDRRPERVAPPRPARSGLPDRPVAGLPRRDPPRRRRDAALSAANDPLPARRIRHAAF